MQQGAESGPRQIAFTLILRTHTAQRGQLCLAASIFMLAAGRESFVHACLAASDKLKTLNVSPCTKPLRTWKDAQRAPVRSTFPNPTWDSARSHLIPFSTQTQSDSGGTGPDSSNRATTKHSLIKPEGLNIHRTRPEWLAKLQA